LRETINIHDDITMKKERRMIKMYQMRKICE
jgi:hypothetical protein